MVEQTHSSKANSGHLSEEIHLRKFVFLVTIIICPGQKTEEKSCSATRHDFTGDSQSCYVYKLYCRVNYY